MKGSDTTMDLISNSWKFVLLWIAVYSDPGLYTAVETCKSVHFPDHFSYHFHSFYS